MKIRSRPACLAVASALALTAAPLAAQTLAIDQLPLIVGGGAAANLLYIHDDSGSMYWSFMPNWYSYVQEHANAAYNKVYFDPSVTYDPPVNADGSSLGDSLYTAAWFDGYDLAGRDNSGNYCVDNTSGSAAERTVRRKVNLSSQYRPTAYYGCYFSTSYSQEFQSGSGTAMSGAYYYSGSTRVNIGTNPFQQQNFANWYSYYRTRNYAARAGISRAFVDLDSNIRVGWATINRIRSVGVNAITRVQPFTGQHKQDFYNWLFSKRTDGTGTGPNGNTPLLGALNAAGQYYSGADPWRDDPTNSSSGLSGAACRKSFTILMTDGYYNDSISSIGNSDGAATTTFTPPGKPGGAAVSPIDVRPFRDNYSNTLADIAWHYWSRDLQGGVANNTVSGTTRDPAWWQHMTTYTIGLGVSGSKNKATAFYNADNNIAQSWGAITSGEGQPSMIDDLLHAAVNGHGDFFAAQNPQEFVEGMKSILSSITVNVSAMTPPASSSSSSQTDAYLFTAIFGPNWYGDLKAYKLDANSNVASVPTWTAGALVPAHGSRRIYTWDTAGAGGAGAGVPFLWNSGISALQKTQLGDDGTSAGQSRAQALLNYLRGETTNEAPNGLKFRSRGGYRLGDIINSAPLYVPSPDETAYLYGTAPSLSDPERAAYLARKATGAARADMVYVGGNDGMLHAFNAANGVEAFAYVPDAVFAKLPELAKQDYTHQYYVDGSPSAGDAWLGGAWKSVLVGSTGAGGKGYFALDVENPGSFGANNVLWEITEQKSGFGNLGVAIGQASIARLNDGTWAAVFGNGYNSAAEKASLFIVDLATGVLLKEIPAGLSTDPVPAVNGLSTPLLVDNDKDGSADAAYAGDLLGRLWKFDLTGNSISAWKLAFSGDPLLQARDAGGRAQPITSQPQAIYHPDGALMVYVGTGRFFVTGDNGNTDAQTFYGIHDDDSAGGITRANLVGQTIQEFSHGGNSYRSVSSNTVGYAPGSTQRGFYIDLPTQGERLVNPPLVWSNRIVFNTLIPVGSSCSGGGVDGWLMEVDFFSGAALSFNVFDMNNDGLFNNQDNLNGRIVSGQKGSGGGVAQASGTLKCTPGDPPVCIKQPGASGSDGTRQSWKQIR
jgi:type IV pilus assembly protein PilY1